MNNEMYAEWLVRRKTPFYTYVLQAFAVALVAVALFLTLVTMWGAILLLLAGGAAFLVFRNVHVEYEYLFVTGSFSVDKILGRSSRKTAWEASMEEIQLIAPADHQGLRDYEKPNMKVLDFTSRMPGRPVYALIHQAKGETVKVLIEPNDKILQCFRQTAPRKVVLAQ
ncbi:MAG: DUF6106 family protein [Lachnospiraceae bacterium]